ncbi:hypothetical protein [Paraburkholderia susongensis]|uniref:hypothetical protein n=1 Tax=Paraburkholderia susongensis TaxID=1515439 RepID=UPI000A1C8AEC|nr:hypothetical protein [Paraburkholderia susongensis]
MKRSRNAEDLAALLRSGAMQPLVGGAPAAVAVSPSPPAAQPASAVSVDVAAEKKGEAEATRQITIRPKVLLWARYINAAAERSKAEGRSITAQEIALEILEKANL